MPDVKDELRENGEFGVELKTGEKFSGTPQHVIESVGNRPGGERGCPTALPFDRINGLLPEVLSCKHDPPIIIG